MKTRSEQSKARQRDLIDYLFSIREGESGDDRAAMADLRKGASRWPTCPPETLRRVVEYFPPDMESDVADREDAVLLIAVLFGLLRGHGVKDGTDLGAVMARVKAKRGGGDTIESRFIALLSAKDRHEIARHIRTAVTLASSSEVPIGWYLLCDDVIQLMRDDDAWRDPVRRRWAKSFWADNSSMNPRKDEVPEIADDRSDES